MRSLNARAWQGVAITVLGMGLLIFLPAGTAEYWQAWLFLGVFLVLTAAITLYLVKHDPALLERRLRAGPAAEKEPAQRIIMLFAVVGFCAMLVVPGFDHRFGWSKLPVWLVLAGDLLVVLGFWIIFFVYRENTFTAATIQVAEDQRVISTGPYAIVRHPMYAGGLIYLFGMPVALGSYWGLIPFFAFTPFLIWRLVDEERLLADKLPGYADYRNRVRSRLIPHVF